ncbi:hypothetical protein [Phaeobacter sp. NW0010-22]|uniref:hypothetical protein n=1 Tax=Phaeobacter sp. NW0010-22 TaxID=3135907 RepID=UPI003107ED1E
MQKTFLYHLNSLTYALPDWHVQMTEDRRAFFRETTTGVLERVACEAPNEILTIEDLTTADLVNLDSVGAEKSVAELERLAGLDQPFFMSIN